MDPEVESIKNEANASFKAGNYEEAVALYSLALEGAPGHPILLSNRSAAFNGMRNFERAAEDARAAISADATYIKPHAHLAVALRGGGELDEAVAVLKKAYAADPTNDSIRNLFTQYAAEFEERHVAAKAKETEAEEKGLQLKSTGNTYFSQKDYDKALEYYTLALRVMPPQAQGREVVLSNRSAAYVMLEKNHEACADALELVEKYPDFAKGHMRLGRALHKLGKLESALAAYKRCLALDASNAAAKEAVAELLELMEDGAGEDTSVKPRAMLLVKENKYSEALNVLAEGIAAHPNDPTLLWLRAGTYMRLDNVGPALDDAVKCTQLRPSWSKGHLRLGEVQEVLALSQNDAEASVRAWQLAVAAYRAAEACPDARPIAAERRAQAEKELASMQREVEMQQRGTLVLPGQDGADRGALTTLEDFEALGDAKYKERIYSGALGYYTQAIKKIKPTPDLYIKRAVSYAKVRRFERAVKDCDEALAIDGSCLKALWYKGKFLLTLERFDDAIQAYALGMMLQQKGVVFNVAATREPDESNADPSDASEQWATFAEAVEHAQFAKRMHVAIGEPTASVPPKPKPKDCAMAARPPTSRSREDDEDALAKKKKHKKFYTPVE